MTTAPTHLWGQIQEWLDGLDFPPSQSKLAERVGVARSAVSAWKLGKAYPTPSNLATLARVMNSAHADAVYERLLEAMLRDQGYVPMPAEQKELMGNAEHPAPNQTPAPGPADQPGRKTQPDYSLGARNTGRRPRNVEDDDLTADPEGPEGGA